MVPESREHQQVREGQSGHALPELESALDVLVRRFCGAGLQMDVVLPSADGGTEWYHVHPVEHAVEQVAAARGPPR